MSCEVLRMYLMDACLSGFSSLNAGEILCMLLTHSHVR